MNAMNFDFLIKAPHWQRLALVLITLVVFWDGLWIYHPRSDQLAYLHNVSEAKSFADIMFISPSFNRTHSDPGDMILYRPLFYLLMGTCYYFFGYNFMLWQAASLLLHILVVLGLHSLFWLVPVLKKTGWPLAITLAFAVTEMGAEMVLWHHVIGYLFYCLILVWQVWCFVRFLASGKFKFGILCLLLGLAGEMVYEPNVILNAIMVFILFVLRLKPNLRFFSSVPEPGVSPKMCFQFAVFFVVVISVLPLASLFDYWYRFGDWPLGEKSMVAGDWLAGAGYMLQQVSRWLSGFFLPVVHDIVPYERAVYVGANYGAGFFHIVNYFAALIILFSAIYFFRGLKTDSRRLLLMYCLPGIVFLLSYSLVIAMGRSVPRGVSYTLNINLYYAYLAQLIFMLLIGLGLFGLGSANLDGVGKQGFRSHARWWLFGGLILIAMSNGLETGRLADHFREGFADKREMWTALADWHKGPFYEKGGYFKVGSSCSNSRIVWFDGHFRKGSGWKGPVTEAEILYPETSFDLNRDKADRMDAQVETIECDGE